MVDQQQQQNQQVSLYDRDFLDWIDKQDVPKTLKVNGLFDLSAYEKWKVQRLNDFIQEFYGSKR